MMKKNIFFFVAFILISFSMKGNISVSMKGNGDGKYEYFPGTYTIVSTTVDPLLKNSEAEFVFTYVDGSGKNITNKAILGYLKEKKQITFDKNNKYRIKVIPGKHRFIFSATDYSSIMTDSISILPYGRIEIKVQLEKEAVNVICRKPVIYLYPETAIEVNLQLDFDGEMFFTYPLLNENNSWNVTAHSDGTLEMNAKAYNYLFWEGNSKTIMQEATSKEGFVVPKENLLTFLENSLSNIGLNSKEQADFITYWYPLMVKNENNFVRFIFNETYNKYAHLDVSPKPLSSIRVFMFWGDAETISAKDVTPQDLPHYNREGFTLVEWGGAEIENIELVYE